MEFEVMSGISSTFAIRHEGKFAGEAVIFGFDYVGGAKVAIRLLPEFWGLGIGSEALELLLFVAEKFDLKRVSTAVKKENVPSIKMTGKFMDYKREEDDTVIFEKTF
jgi:RimJ/RimL family protein N-acetyltransferase